MSDSSRYRFVELSSRPEPGRMICHYFVPNTDAEAISRWRRSDGICDTFALVCRITQPGRGAEYVCAIFLDIDAEGELETDRALRRHTQIAEQVLACRASARGCPNVQGGGNGNNDDGAVWRWNLSTPQRRPQASLGVASG